MDAWTLVLGAAAVAAGWTRLGSNPQTLKDWTHRRSSDASFLCLGVFYAISGTVWAAPPSYLGVALSLAVASVALRLDTARLVAALCLAVLLARTAFPLGDEEAYLDGDDEKVFLLIVLTSGLIHTVAEIVAWSSI